MSAPLVTDLVQIHRQGEQKRRENERFRKHLKTHNFVERRLRRIAEEVEEAIDCTVCGNCCKVATARLVERDVDKLVRLHGIKPAAFLRDYTTESEEEGLILRRDDEHGCVFLDGTMCSIYEARPASCQDFPHLVRGAGSLESRMWQFIDRATYCPIVYNALERWKEEVGFRPSA